MFSCKAETLRRVLARSVLPALVAAVLLGGLGGLGLTSRLGDVASAAKGDFSLDFIAAEDTTYYHRGPSEGNQIGTAEGQDLGYDDRTSNVDVKEELEAVDFECGDRIVFFTAVTVDSRATDTNQTIFLVYDFDAQNNGQKGVGYEEVLAAGISAVDFPPPSQTGDDGNIGLDGNETVTEISESYRPAGSTFGSPDPASRAEHLDVVLKLTGLDPGDQLIVRIDVRFSCFARPVTGNLHAAISRALFDVDGDGAYPDGDDRNISVGQQDVPMLGLGELATPTPTPTPTPPPCPPGGDVEKVSLAVGTRDLVTGECTGPAPTEMGVNVLTDVCIRQVVRNNGSQEACVLDVLQAAAWESCDVWPRQIEFPVTLPPNSTVTLPDADFDIMCYRLATHGFTFQDYIYIDGGLVDHILINFLINITG